MSRLTPSYRASVASRIVAAVLGGYMLTSLAIATLAVYLPLEPAEAALTATMLSFAIYAGIVLWVFAMQSAWRMWLYMAAAAIILKTVLWTHDAVGFQ